MKTFNILSIIFSVNYEKMEPQWSNYDYGQQNVQGKSYGNKRADNNYVLTEL